MPYKLEPPNPARRSPFYRIRGTERGRYLNVSTGTANRREAETVLKAEREEAQRLAFPGAKPALTFDDAAKAYVSAGGEDRFLIPILLRIGQKNVADLDQAAIDACAVAIYPDATPATRNRQAYSPISAVLRHNGISIAFRRPKGSAGTPRTQWLRPPEAFELLKASQEVDERLGALLTFLLYCGPRLSDGLDLNWRDVDLERATALLRDTKNGTSMTVHLPPVVVSELANLPGDHKKGRAFGLTKCGRLYSMWALAVKKANLTMPPRSAFHILRHTHATWRRLYSGADTTALVNTGLWKSRTAAAIYEHVDVSEEARKADMLPTPAAKG